MAGPWSNWEDMPPLVDANPGPQVTRSIPPPPGAAVMNTGPAPPFRVMPPSTPQYPWGTPFPQYASPTAPTHTPHRSQNLSNYTFPAQQDPYVEWRAKQYHDAAAAYQQKSAPSPYIPRQPMPSEMPSHDPFAPVRKMSNTMPSPWPADTPKRSRSQSHPRVPSFHKPFEWPSQGDLSPLNFQSGVSDLHLYAPRAPDMSTPSSSLSRSTSSSSRIAPAMYRERPQQWRQDFKFKSGFASMFRSRTNPQRSLDGFVDSAKLDLHPFLRYSRNRPITIYDIRREPLTLVFRELDRPPLADDMDHSATYPPTQYMRIYHSKLPWYIEIQANGAPYISLADFFQQLYVALNSPVSKYDFYNNELDEEDRDILTRTYLDRCRNKDEKMGGVKRVDFLRGKIEWMGMTPGKNGMWRLKTC